MDVAKLVTKVIGDKKRWLAYKRRAAALPPTYRATLAGVERYLMHAGGVDDNADRMMQMFDDLADLFEQSAAAGTPIREVVGTDPVEFVETFIQNYGVASWISKEQKRLLDAVEQAERQEPRP